ncbi:MAG TPA: Lpg1974 family pore-forming outer membrane protein, partial [Arenibaculum sp.]|nr:Lpg1974 family pore-forming outer membrane protein [Arenibaculum sp.]
GADDAGHVDIAWSVTGAVLFGKQETNASGVQEETYVAAKYLGGLPPLTPVPLGFTPRSKDVTVPLLDLSLGLAYEVGRVKVGAGYRWARYFDVLDGGYDEHQDADRTIDGPYFKIAVGFGG